MTENKNAWFLTDLQKIPSNGKKVFSVFSGGGGSSLGYKLAGFNVIGACDIDKRMAEVYQKNLKPKHFFTCSVNELKNQNLDSDFFNLDILDGSPPCSTFSVSGNREQDWGKNRKFAEGQNKQILSELFFDFIDLANFLKPKIVISENVKGMLIGKAVGYPKMIKKKFKEIGYDTQIFLVNAADCGVPQYRERLFFIARRIDLNFKPFEFSPNKPHVSVEDAIFDLLPEIEKNRKDYEIKLSDQVKKRLFFVWSKIKHGSFQAGFETFLDRKHSHFNLIKIDRKKPSNTITGYPQYYDQKIFRRLTIKELIRLSSFPEDYDFLGITNFAYTVLGMSVAPKAMFEISKEIYRQWLA